MVRKDHYSLKYVLDQCLLMVPQHQWVNKLFSLDFVVKFCPGHLNTMEYALSHCDVDMASKADYMAAAVAALSGPMFAYFDHIHHASATASDAIQLKALVWFWIIDEI
jgi:hypothetical protein